MPTPKNAPYKLALAKSKNDRRMVRRHDGSVGMYKDTTGVVYAVDTKGTITRVTSKEDKIDRRSRRVSEHRMMEQARERASRSSTIASIAHKFNEYAKELVGRQPRSVRPAAAPA